jgi:hypothetical protein
MTHLSYNSTLQHLHKFSPLGYILTQLYPLHKCKGEVAAVLNYAPRHEDICGNGGIAQCILNLGAR